MRINLISLSLLCGFGVIACQPAAEYRPIATPDLPMSLSDDYRADFMETPQSSAAQFLTAYQDFAKSGPVTLDRMEEHLRLQAAAVRGQFLANVLAFDLNGDLDITQSEMHAVRNAPQWDQKTISLADLFEADENQDGRVSFQESVLYSRSLYQKAKPTDWLPIESYLVLSDLDRDGTITDREMKTYIYGQLAQTRAQTVSFSNSSPAYRSNR